MTVIVVIMCDMTITCNVTVQEYRVASLSINCLIYYHLCWRNLVVIGED